MPLTAYDAVAQILCFPAHFVVRYCFGDSVAEAVVSGEAFNLPRSRRVRCVAQD
jgi:hypothetical protein